MESLEARYRRVLFELRLNAKWERANALGTGNGPVQPKPSKLKIAATGAIRELSDSIGHLITDQPSCDSTQIRPCETESASVYSAVESVKIESEQLDVEEMEPEDVDPLDDDYVISPSGSITIGKTTPQRCRHEANQNGSGMDNWERRMRFEERKWTKQVHQMRIASDKRAAEAHEQRMRHREAIFQRKLIYWDLLIARRQSATIGRADTQSSDAQPAIGEAVIQVAPPAITTIPAKNSSWNWNGRP